ncbi:MAG: ABC transporter ATP-binding protein, partial [Clostridia bacterium]|nr:ABC transporter ATP-binding protein [Clostridia bacterium]
MLQLKNIQKHYDTGDTRVEALAGVSIDFRESEFVSILGPSGCGKTTLLNIIGGLDRYSDGDLFINGRSTKDYKDADWDTYRNHSVGFVFQSYNLIPHQTVLSNVELALTLSGISKAERRRRAKEALERVGLGDQLHKKPNQMSGGQMQRVAIARAIVNDPDILLADEPTGALDTTTSVQIMEILKEIAKDKLVIMVTHNPELAEAYSTRIVKLRDGRVIDDSLPFEAPLGSEETVRKSTVKKGKRTSMSFVTALSLSLNNLMTKKGRTFMTSFAGSIGIIGIALILALSNGINTYIALVQEDTLSTYPLSIHEQSQDYSAMLGAMTEVGKVEDHRDSGMIYVDDSMGTMMSAMNKVQKNNLEKFKAYIDSHYDELKPYLSAIQYTYNFDLQVFSGDGKTQVNPTTIFDNMGDSFAGVSDLINASGRSFTAMSEMIDNRELLDQQYEVVAGEWPTEANELVLVISKNNQISKMTLYMLGVLDQSEIEGIITDLMSGKDNYDTTPMDPYEYEDFLGMSFRLLNTSDFYQKTDRTYTVDNVTYPIWQDVRADKLNYDQATFVNQHGMELKITGIVRPAAGATATSISTNLAYTKELTNLILDMNAESEIIAQQKAEPNYNVLTGLKFERMTYTPETIGKLIDTIDDATMETLYAYMTEQVHEGFVETPPVNAQTFLGFVNVMSASEQIQLLEAMLAAATAADPSGMALGALCAGLSDETLAVTPQNLTRVFPILSKEKA